MDMKQTLDKIFIEVQLYTICRSHSFWDEIKCEEDQSIFAQPNAGNWNSLYCGAFVHFCATDCRNLDGALNFRETNCASLLLYSQQLRFCILTRPWITGVSWRTSFGTISKPTYMNLLLVNKKCFIGPVFYMCMKHVAFGYFVQFASLHRFGGPRSGVHFRGEEKRTLLNKLLVSSSTLWRTCDHWKTMNVNVVQMPVKHNVVFSFFKIPAACMALGLPLPYDDASLHARLGCRFLMCRVSIMRWERRELSLQLCVPCIWRQSDVRAAKYKHNFSPSFIMEEYTTKSHQLLHKCYISTTSWYYPK